MAEDATFRPSFPLVILAFTTVMLAFAACYFALQPSYRVLRTLQSTRMNLSFDLLEPVSCDVGRSLVAVGRTRGQECRCAVETVSCSSRFDVSSYALLESPDWIGLIRQDRPPDLSSISPIYHRGLGRFFESGKCLSTEDRAKLQRMLELEDR